MRRRHVIFGLLSSAAPLPFGGVAQPRSKRALVAILRSVSGDAAETTDEVASGLKEFGYVEGRDYVREERHAGGDASRLLGLAEELVRLDPDVIIVPLTAVALAVRRVTTRIPIVGVSLADPVGSGLAQSEARPGTNVTGLRAWVEGLSGKQLSIIRDLLPQATKVGLLLNSDNSFTKPLSAEFMRSAELATINATPVVVGPGDSLDGAFAQLHFAGVDAVVVQPDPRFIAERARIAATALNLRLPTVSTFRTSAIAGGLISYGVDARQSWHRAAYFVHRILNGQNPSEMPIEFPTKLQLVINLKTAQALGTTVPPTLLARADEVIE